MFDGVLYRESGEAEWAVYDVFMMHCLVFTRESRSMVENILFDSLHKGHLIFNHMVIYLYGFSILIPIQSLQPKDSQPKDT